MNLEQLRPIAEKFVKRHVFDDGLREEYVQEALMHVFQVQKKFKASLTDGEREKYCATVVRNKIRDSIRRNRIRFETVQLRTDMSVVAEQRHSTAEEMLMDSVAVLMKQVGHLDAQIIRELVSPSEAYSSFVVNAISGKHCSAREALGYQYKKEAYDPTLAQFLGLSKKEFTESIHRIKGAVYKSKLFNIKNRG